MNDDIFVCRSFYFSSSKSLYLNFLFKYLAKNLQKKKSVKDIIFYLIFIFNRKTNKTKIR
jgi:hypothetical protein